jgi:hypothetical protein
VPFPADVERTTFVIVALLVGTAAGVLTWIGNRNPYLGLLAAGGGFAGMVAVMLGMASFLGAGS